MLANYDGSAEFSSPDPDIYDIQGHFNSGSRLGQLCLRRWSRSRLRNVRQGLGESQWQLPGA